jgi:hypothetical protein
LGFGKDITLFVYLTVIPIVILSTFEEFTGIIYEVHHNYPGKFSVEVFETFPCVSIGMLKQFTLLLHLLFCNCFCISLFVGIN